MKYADRRGSPCAIIQGTNEKAAGKVLIKDLIAGASIGADPADRDAYREQQAQAQIEIEEANLVAEVQALLTRHNIDWK
jgi:histidyl-tRNA synthetase